MKTEHTPGPWQHDPVWHLIYGPNKVEIAAIHAAVDLREKRRVNMDTAIANARLIAAVTDLLEACKAMEIALSEASCISNKQEAARIQARQAIRKAEGKE